MPFAANQIQAVRRATLWLWESPTFTIWGNYAVQSLRLVIVTPLLVTRFNETEIAAWYLFASLNFFGTILSQRLGSTFSRMFAFALAGASNLGPIKGARPAQGDGNPNWKAFERAYGTVGSINLGVGWINVLVATVMGWYGLANILIDYDDVGAVWVAFALMQSSSLLVFIFQRWAIALQGMNKIALINRWGIVIGVLSSVAGSISLVLGAGLITLTLVMQLMAVVGVFINRLLLQKIEGGRVLQFPSLRMDREMFSWAWAPTWKGFIGEFGQSGAIQLTAIIFTSVGSKSEVAAYLFALRMMQTITILAQAPFNAVLPLMSRLRAASDVATLKPLVIKRAGFSLILMSVGILGGAAFFPAALSWIGSSLNFIPVDAWLLLGGLLLLARFNIFCCAVSAIGNEMIYYWHSAIGALVGVGFLWTFRNEANIYLTIVASTLPSLTLMNLGPFRHAKKILQIT